MKIAVMQPYLFPYIGYFQLINSVERFVIYDDVNLIKRGWINRNNILINCKANLFTVPLKQSSQNKLIIDTEISDDEVWKINFLKTLELNYKKAPFFNEVYSIINEIILSEEKKLSDFIFNSLNKIKNYIDINTVMIRTSSVYLNNILKKQERIIDICRQENADTYNNLFGGMQIYSKELFTENGIKLNFLRPKEIRYKQFNCDFIDSLSIIDVLMFNSTGKIKEFLKEYDLI